MRDGSERHTRLALALDVVRTGSIAIACAVGTWAVVRSSVVPPDTGRPEEDAAAAVRPRPEPRVPAEPLPIGNAWTEGPAAAPVIAIVYSDFQCPFCASFSQHGLPRPLQSAEGAPQARLALRAGEVEHQHPRSGQASTFGANPPPRTAGRSSGRLCRRAGSVLAYAR